MTLGIVYFIVMVIAAFQLPGAGRANWKPEGWKPKLRSPPA